MRASWPARGLRTGLVLVAMTLGMTLPASAAPAAVATLAQTTAGEVRGKPDRDTIAFLGIPYAASTGGANRFLAPQKLRAWKGVRDAAEYGPRCPQQPTTLEGEMRAAVHQSESPMSEDCLTLNVWTPAPDAGKRPVMVWLHGGAWAEGSGNEGFFQGAHFAHDHDVVFVAVNHRVNGFGFLDLASTLGPTYAASSNAGLLDLVQALHWVHDNVGRFGGDPGNVTIFGESGGAGKVLTLFGTPAASGLFHKGIAMSGSARMLPVSNNPRAVEAILEQLPGDHAAQLQGLLHMPMQPLIEAMGRANYSAGASPTGTLQGDKAAWYASWGPHADGRIVPTSIWNTDAPGISAQIPLMIGTNADEATTFLMADPTWASMDESALNAKASALFGALRAASLLAAYRSAHPDLLPMHIWSAMLTDMSFDNRAIATAEMKAAQHAAPIYKYKLLWRSPMLNGKLRAGHGVDTPLFLENLDIAQPFVGAGEDPAIMSRWMSDAIAAFARSGNPDVPGGPHWPGYDAQTRATLLFKLTPAVVDDPDRDTRLVWLGLGSQPHP